MHPSLSQLPRDTFAISTPTDRSIEIRREFAAPPGLLWDAWTRPELLRRWYGGPSGWRLAASGPAFGPALDFSFCSAILP